VKIEFSNGSVIETPETSTVTRGLMSNFIEFVKINENEENDESR
jgi:hypothetical protein